MPPPVRFPLAAAEGQAGLWPCWVQSQGRAWLRASSPTLLPCPSSHFCTLFLNFERQGILLASYQQDVTPARLSAENQGFGRNNVPYKYLRGSLYCDVTLGASGPELWEQAPLKHSKAPCLLGSSAMPLHGKDPMNEGTIFDLETPFCKQLCLCRDHGI